MIPASLGTQVLQSQILFLEDDIKNKLGMNKETIGSGSNNHVFEVMLANQYGAEKLERQRLHRQIQ